MINKGIQRLENGLVVIEIIDVCRKCKGEGYTHEGSPELAVMKECILCKGCGRVLIRKEINVIITPYNPIKKINYKPISTKS